VATPGVDFFRVDRSRSTKRLLTTAAALIAAGATSMGAHLVHRITPAMGSVISLAGGVLTLAGLVLGFGTMAMMLFEDIYLHIREDGLLVHRNGQDMQVPWEDLAGVDVDARRGLLRVRAGAAGDLDFFAGAAASSVATRIEEAKRKASLGILKVSSG
jgi:hypothetical protein